MLLWVFSIALVISRLLTKRPSWISEISLCSLTSTVNLRRNNEVRNLLALYISNYTIQVQYPFCCSFEVRSFFEVSFFVVLPDLPVFSIPYIFFYLTRQAASTREQFYLRPKFSHWRESSASLFTGFSHFCAPGRSFKYPWAARFISYCLQTKFWIWVLPQKKNHVIIISLPLFKTDVCTLFNRIIFKAILVFL